MSRRWVLLRPLGWVCLALALAPASARAAERPRGRQVAVLEVKTTGTFDPKSVAALSSFIATEVARYPVKVVAGSDLQALLGFERQRQLMGCTDSTCLAEIGGGLGVDYLLSAEVGEIGGRWLLTLVLLDVKKAVALKRVGKSAKNQAQLVDLASAAVGEIFTSIALSPASDTEPGRDEGTKALPAAVATAGVDEGRPRRIAGYALIGVGAASIAGGAVAGVLSYVTHSQAVSNPPTTPQELADKRNAITTQTQVADALYAVGIVAAGVGLVLALTAPSAPTGASAPASAPPAAVSFAPLTGGGALVVSGGF